VQLVGVDGFAADPPHLHLTTLLAVLIDELARMSVGGLASQYGTTKTIAFAR
jgi:hypothetical protein